MNNHNISPLQPTAPRFSKENHTIYLDILEEAINSPNNKNIGIIGKFGTGKSSIIEGFLKKHPYETAIISIPSFNGNVPAHSESANDNSENQHNLDENLIKSSHLQKEVLKQLFYSKHGKNISSLKYDKIHEISSSRKILSSLLLGTLLWVLSWTIKFPQNIYNFFSPFTDYINNLFNKPGLFDEYWLSYIFFIPFITAILYTTGITEKINKIAGMQVPGISLSFRSPNYFDANTEQILYFFAKNKIKYVVFEDLDRFKNIEILEQLKYLNTIINNMIAGDIEPEEKTIHFIYTLDDAIYFNLNEEKTGQSTKISPNKEFRNKFFDISFSVMPHISPLNSQGIINGYLKDIEVTATEESGIKSLSALINDNRLAINIVNDFKVYSAQLSKSSWFKSSEQQTNILAMLVAYKNLNPSDFNSFVSSTSESNYHMIRENFEKFVNEFSEEKSEEQFKKFRNLLESTYTPENHLSYIESVHLHDSLKKSAETTLKIRSANQFVKKIDKIESLISDLRKSNIITAKDFDILSKCIISTQEILSKNLALKLIMQSDTSFKSEYSLYCVTNSSTDQTYDTLAYLFGNLSTVDKLRYNLPQSSVKEILSYEPLLYDASLIYNQYILKFLADQKNNHSDQSTGNKFSNKFRKDILILIDDLKEIFNFYWNIEPLEWDNDENRWTNAGDYKKLSAELISTIQKSNFGSFINETFNYFDIKEILPLLDILKNLGDNLKINSCIRYILSCLVYSYQIDIDHPEDSSLVRYPDHVLALLFFSLISTDTVSSEESEFGNFYAKNHANTDLFDLHRLDYVDDFLELDYVDDFLERLDSNHLLLPNLEKMKKILSESTFLKELLILGNSINIIIE